VGQLPGVMPAGLNAEELQQKYPNLFPVIANASGHAGAVPGKKTDSGKTRYEIHSNN
jgi:hypothetical protein